jgi:hypothetical protein
MDKNELTGVIGIGVIVIILAICVPLVWAASIAMGVILLALTGILAIGVVTSVVGALPKKEKPVEEEITEEV